MTMQFLRNALRNGSTGMILAALLGMGCFASAAAAQKKPAAPAPKPATTHAPTGGGATSHGPTSGGASHGPTTGGASHGPTTGGASHGPTTGGTTHGPTTTGGTRAGVPGGAGSHGPAGNHSPIGHGPAPRGSNDHVAANGSTVRTRPDGSRSDVHDPKRGVDIHHGLNGNRRVSVDRPGHGRLVAERGRPGYVQRGYGYHGHDFGRRAYYYHGHEYNRYYRGYGYRGLYLNVYAPGFYYGPGFYGWAYNPWTTPIAYGWGWGGSPWYGYYGGFFAPYPVYPSASYWLTDYIISQDLQAAYAAHQEAGETDGAPSAAGGPPEMTPEVKQQIADEVRDQLALENQEAAQNAQQQDGDPGSSGIARMLSDGHPHVFVAGDALDVVDASGQECGISDGDALQLQPGSDPNATSVNLVVLASKGGRECHTSDTVTVQLADLQEMQNHMRENIDQGLQELQAKQGKGGIPQAPPSAQAKPTEAAYAAVAPPPDPTDTADLQQQGQQADQAEKEATGDAPPNGAAPAGAAPPAPAAPASVQLGQTPDQVQASLGAPKRMANLGPKVIYYYDGMKVTFTNGKVSNVQ